MALSTLDELQSRYDALTGRIVALDVDISRELDSERRKTLSDRRIELATEREKVASDIAILHPGYPLTVVANAPILEARVSALERDVRKIWGILRPTVRLWAARTICYILIVVTWSMWMIKELRDWFLLHPPQAVAITLSLILTAVIIRWLPEDDNEKR